MSRRILVINPNSNASVTAGLSKTLELHGVELAVDISCRTLEDGPFGIETDDDISTVTPLVVDAIASANEYDAFVIACYSDPGLKESKTASDKPVYGIHESAVRSSVAAGKRFGVLALGEDSIQRHIAYVIGLGLQSLHVGERSLDLSVDDAANDPTVLDKIVDTGRQLIDEVGAEVLILGCAGMATHRKLAEQRLGVPVIDPVQAAVTMAAEALTPDGADE